MSINTGGNGGSGACKVPDAQCPEATGNSVDLTANPVASSAADTAPSDLYEKRSDGTNTFYVNTRTRTSVWELPENAKIVKVVEQMHKIKMIFIIQ